MINPSALQTISQIAIAIGIFITAIGGYGVYHFGKKADKDKEKLAAKEIQNAKNERKEIKELLEPFAEYAREKFPNENDSVALSKLASEIKKIEEKTKELEEKVYVWSLSDEQIDNMAARLKIHKNINVRMICENDASLNPFIEDLKEVFKRSGWTVIKDEVAIVEAINGINIFGKGDAKTSAPQFIADFYLCLKEFDIDISNLSGDKNLSDNLIVLKIGRKK